MKTGRPPQWNPVATLSDSTWTEVVAVTSKSRVHLPISARARLAWDWPSEPFALLATLEPGNSAEMQPWTPRGEAVMHGLEKLLAEEPEPERDQLALVAMDRYLKVMLDPDGRLILPINLAHHLDAINYDAIRVIVRSGRLILWSEVAWQLDRPRRLEACGTRLYSLEGATRDQKS